MNDAMTWTEERGYQQQGRKDQPGDGTRWGLVESSVVRHYRRLRNARQRDLFEAARYSIREIDKDSQGRNRQQKIEYFPDGEVLHMLDEYEGRVASQAASPETYEETTNLTYDILNVPRAPGEIPVVTPNVVEVVFEDLDAETRLEMMRELMRRYQEMRANDLGAANRWLDEIIMTRYRGTDGYRRIEEAWRERNAEREEE